MLQLAIVAAAILTGLTLSFEATRGLGAIDDAEQAAELVVATEELRAAFGRAEGAAVNGYLAGGIEPPEQRQRYLQATSDAGAALADAGRAAEGNEALVAVGHLQEKLPIYTGLIETARAGNRQQLPLGAAYLRSASELIRSSLEGAEAGSDGNEGNEGTTVPAVDIVGELDILRADGDQSYRSSADQVRRGVGLITLVIAVPTLALLGYAQWWLLRRTNRIVNVGAAGAFCLALIALIATASLSDGAASRTRQAAIAYDQVAALSALRADAYDQQASSTFALVDRGARDAFNAQAATAAQNVEARLAAAEIDATAQWNEYLAVSETITGLDSDGDYGGARSLAFDKPALFESFDGQVAARVEEETASLIAELDSARAPLVALQLAGIPLGLAVGAIAAWGLQQRMNDYR